MEVVKININNLKPYERNAKLHPEYQIEQIKKSIEEFGFNDPIAVWGKDNLVVEGHGRLLALKELGYEEVDCIRLDHLTDEERKAYTLAHNKVNMNSGFDYELLNLELNDLPDIDMSDFGFDISLDTDYQSDNTLGGSDTGLVESKVRGYSIAYELVFENEEQQDKWYDFVGELRVRYPECKTIAERVLKVAEEWLNK